MPVTISGPPTVQMPGALMSACGRYRYRLTRPPLHESRDAAAPLNPPALFIMLNPSTADAVIDDPTIRRCRAFAHAWQCDGVIVANLYALRSTRPAGLWLHEDPVGPDNDGHLYALARSSAMAICAWGDNARAPRVIAVLRLLRDARITLACLGTTRSGAPRHPLYVRGETRLVEWKPAYSFSSK